MNFPGVLLGIYSGLSFGISSKKCLRVVSVVPTDISLKFSERIPSGASPGIPSCMSPKIPSWISQGLPPGVFLKILSICYPWASWEVSAILYLWVVTKFPSGVLSRHFQELLLEYA